MIEFLLNNNWKDIYKKFIAESKLYEKNYIEALNFSYKIDPFCDYFMSDKSTIFTKEKAKAIYKWYKRHDSRDHSIEEFFEEYKGCTDENHLDFNSNYGLYAFDKSGLDLCCERLAKNNMSRQAMFCINNKEAMSDNSIDKLCTNTIQFYIRDNKLVMIVQMRASNFFTLLPYDSFSFCFWYFYVFNKLYNEYHLKNLERDFIHINASSIHFYTNNLDNLKEYDIDYSIHNLFEDYKDSYFIEKFEKKLNS